MIMKKLVYTLSLIFMLSTLTISTQAKDVDPKLTTEQVELRVSQLRSRVEEIRSIDRSNLSKEQRKELRNELRDMNKEAKAISGGGVYLSVGAIIIIILVLILLL